MTSEQERRDSMIRALYLSGQSTYVLAVRLGTSQGSIARSLRRSIKEARKLQIESAA